ncbi:MAG TPA: serine hydrolase domain-containing protein [Cyclobacteriaceae bacterium]
MILKHKNTAKLLVYAFLFLFQLQVYAQTDQRVSSQVKDRIAQVESNLVSWVKLDSVRNWNIYQRMKELRVKGVCIAVIDNFKIDWVNSYGLADTLEGRAVTNETLFQSASIGKSINGFAFAKLHQDKKVDLSKDINLYLHSWKFPYDNVSKGKHIDLLHILSHTAGLTVHGFDGYKWHQPLPNLLQIINGTKPANNNAVRSEIEPGIKFQYSGGGYEISELLLQDATHKSYEDYITTSIFKPLRMKSSTYQLKPTSGLCATAYRFDGKDIGCKYHLYPEKACGAGLWTTAADLARFVIEIQLALQGKSKILTTESARLMTTPVLETSNYAMGFFIEKRGGVRYFQHSGLNEGFSSQYYGSIENGRGVVVLINSDNMSLLEEIVNSVATVYGWPDFYSYIPKKIVNVSHDVLDRYVGSYKFENGNSGPTIFKEHGDLYLRDPGSPTKWRMYFTSEKEFFMLEARWANQQFFLDENGRVQGFYILGDNYKAVVKKLN